MIDSEIQLEKLAEQGLPDPQYTMAARYYYGLLGKPQSYEEAAKWYLKAAEQGHAKAQFNLGCMYNFGEGVSKSYEVAAHWYRKAAEQGHARAQYQLDFMCRDGQIKPDIAATAEQGNVEDQHSLGVRYKNGIGVPQDSAEAMKWFRMAAEQGNPDAQFALASMYNQGTGVEMDSAEAVKWYERAAEQGHEPAKSILGSMKITGMYASSDAQTSTASEQPDSTVAPSITLLMEKVARLEKSEQYWKDHAKMWEQTTASAHALADKIANELLSLRAENYVLKRKLDECGTQAPSEDSHEEQPPRVRL